MEGHGVGVSRSKDYSTNEVLSKYAFKCGVDNVLTTSRRLVPLGCLATSKRMVTWQGRARPRLLLLVAAILCAAGVAAETPLRFTPRALPLAEAEALFKVRTEVAPVHSSFERIQGMLLAGVLAMQPLLRQCETTSAMSERYGLAPLASVPSRPRPRKAPRAPLPPPMGWGLCWEMAQPLSLLRAARHGAGRGCAPRCRQLAADSTARVADALLPSLVRGGRAFCCGMARS